MRYSDRLDAGCVDLVILLVTEGYPPDEAVEGVATETGEELGEGGSVLGPVGPAPNHQLHHLN